MMFRLSGRSVFWGLQLKEVVRSYCNAKASKVSGQNVQEVKIPVPWGHVAGKWWGDSNVQPIIGLHGWEDNANTFDTLAPLLTTPSFLAIDFIGHGLSSHFPSAGAYHFMDFVALIRRIVDHFKWTKLSVIGHSFGSAVAFMYSALFPDDVEAYVALDCVRTLIMQQKEDMLSGIRFTLDKCLAMEERVMFDPPSYTYEELRELVYNGSQKSPSLESCDILLQRGMKKLSDGERYCLARDPRLKARLFISLPEDLLLACASRIKCRVLNIRADRGFVHGGKPEEVYLHTLDLMQQCERHVVAGRHHVHLNNPERVAPLINKFLNTPRPKL